MPWNGRWLLSAAALLSLASLGFWAKARLDGCEACPPPAAQLPAVPMAQVQMTAPPQVIFDPQITPAAMPMVTEEVQPMAPPPLAAVAGVTPPAEVAPTVAQPPAPPAPVEIPTPPPVDPAPLAPAQPTPPPFIGPNPPLAPVVVQPLTCPWTLHIRLVEGVTKLEARTAKGVRFVVNCERLTLQAPDGKIEALGKVVVSAPDLEGTCSQLSISWRDERVTLEGAVNVKCRQNGQEADLAGERVSLKLTATESAASSTPSDDQPRPPVSVYRAPVPEQMVPPAVIEQASPIHDRAVRPASFRPKMKPASTDPEDLLRPLDGPQSRPR